MARTAVLIHGAHHGGWCWKRVVRQLDSEGWDVFAPSLTGSGDRAHLLNEEVTLDTRIQDIVGLLEAEELHDVVMCAHSAGGMVATGVAERVAGRISSLIMLDAVVPEDGESLFDILAAAEGISSAERQAQSSATWVMPAARLSAGFFGVTDPSDAAWVERHLTDDSALVMAQRLIVTDGLARVGRRTFVRTTRFQVAGLDRVYSRLKADPAWKTHSWDVGHDAMIDNPNLVARLIADA